MCGSGWWQGQGNKDKNKSKPLWRMFYSIMLDGHRVTSMADTDIDTVQKRKNAERNKKYRL
jgi:hypothetical protein